MAIPATELFGATYHADPFYVGVSKKRMSRGASWDRALQRPPIIKVKERFYVPYREHSYSGYRKDHTATEWRWYVEDWQPLEESHKGQGMIKELKSQLAHRLFGWMNNL